MFFHNQMSASSSEKETYFTIFYTALKFQKIRKNLNRIPKMKCQHNILMKLLKNQLIKHR